VRARHSKYEGDQRQCSGRDERAEKITQDLSTWTCGRRARAFPSEGLRCVLLEPRCPEADLTTGFTRTSRNRGALVMLVVGHQGCAGAPVGHTPAGDPPSAERGLPNWATESKNARQPFLESLEHSVAGHHAPLYSAVSCNWGCQRSWCDRSPRRGLVFVDGPEPLQRLLRELRASPIVTRCCSPDTSPTGVDSSPFGIAADCMIPESIHR
jgi:hypothetical protein